MGNRHDRNEKAVIKRLENRNGRDVVLYGTDTFSQYIYENLIELGINVLYFVEDDTKINELKGKMIKNPFELFAENKKDIFVLVARMTNHGEAYRKLIDMNFIYEKDFTIMGIHGYMDACDSVDTLLGYNRNDDLLGFRIFGENKENSYKIVTLGGSTTDPSLGYCKSWSEFLYCELKKLGYDITVYCGGLAGYASTQEFLKLNRDVLELNPNMVLTLSGVNDAVFLGDIGEKYPFVNGYQSNFFNYLLKNNIMPPDTLDMRNVRNISYGLDSKLSDYEIWINNMRKMNSVCNEFDIIFRGFLQPMIYCGGYIIDPELENMFEEYIKLNKGNVVEKKVNKDNMEFFIKNIKKHLNKYPYIIDLTNVFSGMSNVYFDWCHYNEKGSFIIADNIMEEIKKYLIVEKRG